ncbi:preprotein translocase subunit TatA [Brachybacterium phenoliresistens]|uniref:Sec-independent protein translocase protein TatC n=2 Tax=Brachybacterium phenoliresistens TaxID=396014 RepID=Z9JWZ5_9MICO|nr:preprotein translocase subunit TatA [Brachybacterium phenoliresistens]
MALGEHLAELRNRLMWCAGTVLVMSIVGWFLYEWVLGHLQAPIQLAKEEYGLENLSVNFKSAGAPLNVKLQISAYIGLILSAPMFLYQVWSFVMPGLHKNERRYALGFFGAAIPLFFVGTAAGYWVMLKAVPILLSFTPAEASNVIDFADYLRLWIKTMLAFGIAFLMPVVLVLLNFLGILPGKTMLKAWRWVTFLCFCFTAVMVPTPDPFTMIFMALPMVGLYFAAVLIGIIRDKRRKETEDDGLADDEASVIDDAPEDVDGPSSLDDDEDAPRRTRRS